ncbi:hypothetical protein N9N67_05355 [Bacteriovoracaceae bacterium]|nr:hypothetical protein [Bacteriovoracaceae bacterium]
MRIFNYHYSKLSLLFLILFVFSCKEEGLIEQNITEKISLELLELWNKPSKSQIKKFSCGKLNSDISVGASFFSCNPYFLICALNKLEAESKKKGLTFLKQQNEFLHPRIIAHPSIKQKKFSYELKLVHGDEESSLFFLHHCRERLLPQGSYLTLNDQGDEKVWDNYQQKIWLDQFYVSNLDIYFWKKELYQPKRSLSMPSVNLSNRQMKAYCKSIGKKLAKSHIVDAFSIPPSNFNRAYSPKLFYYPFVADKDKNLPYFKDENFKIEQIDCLKSYTKECREVIPLDQVNFYDTSSSSWNGVYFLQGFLPEVTENIFFPNENLSLSSYYISRLSDFIQNARRIPNANLKKVLDDESIPQGKMMRAFRCMRE